MYNIFLETASLNLESGAIAALVGLFAAFLVVFLVIGLGIWIYISFAYMSLAKKNKQKSAGIAWIPYIGPAIIAYRSSKMHWWPWLLLIGFFIPAVGGLFGLVFFGFFIAWNYKLFEAVNKPGWWAILYIIPFVGLIMAGIVAWSD